MVASATSTAFCAASAWRVLMMMNNTLGSYANEMSDDAVRREGDIPLTARSETALAEHSAVELFACTYSSFGFYDAHVLARMYWWRQRNYSLLPSYCRLRQACLHYSSGVHPMVRPHPIDSLWPAQARACHPSQPAFHPRHPISTTTCLAPKSRGRQTSTWKTYVISTYEAYMAISSPVSIAIYHQPPRKSSQGKQSRRDSPFLSSKSNRSKL